MSFIHATFFSPVLQKQVQMNVILPEIGKPPFPTFYLLHGLSDDCGAWMRRSSIERYVSQLPLAVVMPDGFRGFYTDNAAGPAFGKYMIEDVIGFAERSFPLSQKRAARCIGGLSMGGYGAFRLALAHPEKFVSANSHSGAFNLGWIEHRDPEFARIFGKRPKGSAHDVFSMAAKLKRARSSIPKLQFDCGTEDFLIEHSRRFSAHLKALKFPHQYTEYAGAHTWDYWDNHVRKAIVFHCKALGISKPTTSKD